MTTLSLPALHLLHAASFGTLATHSEQVPGYPFATVLPFVPDEYHCPVFLVSALAEHTRNILADGRASLLVAAGDGKDVLREARLTLVGNIAPYDASDAMLARYLRYQPDARRYLQLGDFRFFRLTPMRARYIAGFGEMGWLEAAEWKTLPPLSDAAEEAMIIELASSLPAGARVLGIDCCGMDLERQGKRERHPLPNAPINPALLPHALQRYLAAL